VRHGRSAHAQSGWIDADGLRGWLRAYDAAGLAADQAPPAALRVIAAQASAVVASDMPRALASAALLAEGAAVTETPLLRELDAWMPGVRWVRLPLPMWALAIGAGRAIRTLYRETPAEQRERVGAAADWLEALADERGGTVLAVTHASFRRVLAMALADRGWRVIRRAGWVRPWSAWMLVRESDGR
jgi:broad specificity phosphatase PhoE